MKRLKLSNKSWHYFIASMGGFCSVANDINICAYFEQCLMGIFFVLLFSSLILLNIVGLFVAVYFWCHGVLSPTFVTGGFIPTFVNFCFVMFNVTVALAIVVGAGLLLVKLFDNRGGGGRKKFTSKKQSFIASAYRSIKDKVCFRLRFY